MPSGRWEGYEAHLPNEVEILDFYHVMEHVAQLSAAQFDQGSKAAAACTKRIK